MKSNDDKKDDSNLEWQISLTLRIGVILSSLLVIIGLGLYFIEGDQSLLVSNSFTLFQVITGLASGNPIAIVLLGVAVLVITPVLRVFELLLSYLGQRDKTYVAFSFLVLLFVVVGIVLLPILTRS
jgi:uncharacterized membrane protein